MKQIIGYLKLYYRETFSWKVLLPIVLFVAAATAYNYKYNFMNDTLEAGEKNLEFFTRNFLFYLSPILFSYIIIAWVKQKWSIMKQPGFWILLLGGAAIFSYRVTWALPQFIIDKMIEIPHVGFWFRCLYNLLPGLVVMTGVFILWVLFDRNRQPFYGFTRGEIKLKPYLVLIALMIPVIVLAGLQGDFLAYYPNVIRAFIHGQVTENALGYGIIYEICYGLDFISIETFFRGFLILGLMRYAGREVILPMAAFYVFIHFEKPLGETISSFFGGWLLGIIAYETKSVWGGVTVHLGIAWMMELVAILMKMMLAGKFG